MSSYTVLFDLRPPTTICLDPMCRRQDSRLTEPINYKAVLFTRDHGPIPISCTSLYCRGKPLCSFACRFLITPSPTGCHTRYHHNYYVHEDATLRTYYSGVPDLIQSSKKVFIERGLCERFANQMVMAWYVVSLSVISVIYVDPDAQDFFYQLC